MYMPTNRVRIIAFTEQNEDFETATDNVVVLYDDVRIYLEEKKVTAENGASARNTTDRQFIAYAPINIVIYNKTVLRDIDTGWEYNVDSVSESQGFATGRFKILELTRTNRFAV